MGRKINNGVMMFAAGAWLLASGSAIASTPGDVRDLVGARASSGEEALNQRGYSLSHSEKGDDRVWSYWWNRGSKQCITVATVDGRYDSITATSAVDCNQKSGGGSGDTAAAAAIGAAAIIGIAALAHKSHHHDNATHYDNSQSEADYERGYRDGLYGQSYRNPGNSDPYSKGYTAGVAQQGHETSYRHGGYGASPVGYDDLNGARGSSADSEMQSRGFTNVDGLKSGNTSYTIWYCPSSEHLAQVAA